MNGIVMAAVDGPTSGEALDFWKMIVLVVVGGGTAGLAGGGLVTWLVKKLVNGLVIDNRRLTDAVVDQVKLNAVAMEKLTGVIDTTEKVRAERDKSMFAALHRIESGIRHRGGGT